MLPEGSWEFKGEAESRKKSNTWEIQGSQLLDKALGPGGCMVRDELFRFPRHTPVLIAQLLFFSNNYQVKRNCLLRDYLCSDMWKAKQSYKISTVRDRNLEEENRKHETNGNPKINGHPAKESLRQGDISC